MSKTLIYFMRVFFAFVLTCFACVSFAGEVNYGGEPNLSNEEKFSLTHKFLENEEVARFVCFDSFAIKPCKPRSLKEVLDVLQFGSAVSSYNESEIVFVEPVFNTREKFTGFFRKECGMYRLLATFYNTSFRVTRTDPLTIEIRLVTDNTTQAEDVEEFVFPKNMNCNKTAESGRCRHVFL